MFCGGYQTVYNATASFDIRAGRISGLSNLRYIPGHHLERYVLNGLVPEFTFVSLTSNVIAFGSLFFFFSVEFASAILTNSNVASAVGLAIADAVISNAGHADSSDVGTNTTLQNQVMSHANANLVGLVSSALVRLYPLFRLRIRCA